MKPFLATFAALPFAAILFTSGHAAAQAADPAARFGARGQVVLTDESTLSISSTTWSTTRPTSFTVSVGPGVDWFVVRNLSLGLTFDTAYSDTKTANAGGGYVETRSTRVTGGLRVGYNIEVGPTVSFYPRLALGAEWVRSEEDQLFAPGGSAISNENGPWIEGSLPLLVHAAPHYFIGLSPNLTYVFGNGNGGPGLGGERVTGGADLIVGGWLGGQGDTAREPDAVGGRGWRFGHRGQIVIGSDFTGTANGAGYTGGDASSWGVGLSPGIDGFVADHVSLGVGGDVTYDSTVSFDQVTGAKATATNTNLGIAPRFGVDIPFGALWSLYPRLSVGFGWGNHTTRSEGLRNDYQDNYVDVAVYAPLLLHPADHFFVGLGPSITQDLWHGSSNDTQSLRTTPGAALTMGGYF